MQPCNPVDGFPTSATLADMSLSYPAQSPWSSRTAPYSSLRRLHASVIAVNESLARAFAASP